jgi:hypothetical protein
MSYHQSFCIHDIFPLFGCLSERSLCSTKPAAADVIGIDLGTTNSCVSVMEGKVCFSPLHQENRNVLFFVSWLLYLSEINVMTLMAAIGSSRLF